MKVAATNKYLRQAFVGKEKFYQIGPRRVIKAADPRLNGSMPNANLKIRTRSAVTAFFLMLLQTFNASAVECSAASGEQRVALLELYTSEGCSSCPPADKWLSKLSTQKLVPGALLPLAFHVDYWNDLGWKDPFSQAKFSDRQREYSKRRGASFVVTPQLLLDGQGYQRPLLIEDIDNKAKSINRSPPRASIRINQTQTPERIDARVEVRVADTDARQARVYVALYENNLATAVKAGENKGALLKHDFVVRELSTPIALDDSGRLSHDVSIRLAPDWKSRDLHLAAFAQHPRSGEVLQALSSACR